MNRSSAAVGCLVAGIVAYAVILAAGLTLGIVAVIR